MKNLLYVLLFFSILTFSTIAQCQNQKTTDEFIVKYEKIKFKFNDTIFPFTIFYDKNYFFEEGYTSTPDSGMIDYRSINSKIFVVKYESKKSNDSTLIINSYFPRLITNTHPYVNEYDYDYQPMNLIHELNYSFLLSLFSQPIINNDTVDGVLRITSRENNEVICLDLHSKNISYLKGHFDSDAKFNVDKKLTKTLDAKRWGYVTNAMKMIDFDKENYFTIFSQYVGPKYLIEYKTKDNYYIIERPMISNRKEFKKFKWLYMSLYSNSR